MPRYIIIRIIGRGKSQKCKVLGLTPMTRNIRTAWVYYKRNFKRSLNKKGTYHIFPINHGRYWDFKNGKWSISSWYGNHKIK